MKPCAAFFLDRVLRLAAISTAMLAIAACTSRDASVVAIDRLQPCRLPGIEREARCGALDIPENPDVPTGRTIRVGYAVVPATATHKSNDAILVLAGGPGQSAISIAGSTWPLFDELNARRDIVYIDQRGTSRSHPLECAPHDRRVPRAESIDPARERARITACRDTLAKTTDLAQYATWIAVRDFERVRVALGYPTLDLWGGSYGTRAALEYARQFPEHVRALVLDGVAPADLVLPASFARDADAAFEALARACSADAHCAKAHPDLLAQIDALLASAQAGLRATLSDPYFGTAASVTLDRPTLAQVLRTPLYSPSLSAALPDAVDRARQGDLTALAGLAAVMGEAIEGEGFSEGMHYAVICSEDATRPEANDRAAVASTRMRDVFIEQYARICADWPTRPVPAAYFAPPVLDAPVLLLSGGLDPATPPPHAERVAHGLPHAMHVVAPHLGHLVSMQGCAPSLVKKFIRQGNADGLDASCLQRIPAPWFYAPPVAKPAQR